MDLAGLVSLTSPTFSTSNPTTLVFPLLNGLQQRKKEDFNPVRNLPGHSYIYSFIQTHVLNSCKHQASIRYGNTALNRGFQSIGGGRQITETYKKCDGNPAWGTWERLHSLELKEESKFTKQNSGSEFLAEGIMFAKAIILKERELTRGWGEAWSGWIKKHAGK